jgi:hypothetical protein
MPGYKRHKTLQDKALFPEKAWAFEKQAQTGERFYFYICCK